MVNPKIGFNLRIRNSVMSMKYFVQSFVNRKFDVDGKGKRSATYSPLSSYIVVLIVNFYTVIHKFLFKIVQKYMIPTVSVQLLRKQLALFY